ncbi:GNAT family N-acetyltransferase [Streptomyces sp. NBC_01268]|uniref:GNAT family N-acetyltransferase n=1 Tax=Streptomyces sp. NBC_01268 TaxID=2903806 RepID=UPI002E328B8E|nr:GNAT family N-acetyltransferase [Streptomyces sp. NBC_01268]
MSLEVRAIDESEFAQWLRTLRVGFLRTPVVADGEVVDRLPHTDLSRTFGAFDRGRMVATFQSFDQELSTVGGANLAADAVSGVTVSPTHRRRGLLSRMMKDDLAAAKERGDACATLIAAEYPIYGRFGFGPASWTTEWSVDVTRAGFDLHRPGSDGDDGGRIDLTDGAEIRAEGPALHRRMATGRAGITARRPRNWDVGTGNSFHHRPWTEPFYAMYRSGAGEVEGYVAYTADDKWTDGNQPVQTATVRDLVAVTPAAERALWRYVCSIDWITSVRSGSRAPDALLPLLLPDPRAARVVTHTDMLWLRILDVPKVLEPRTYAAEGTLVLDVRDAAGLAGGRYRLDTSPEPGGSSCVPTDAAPDLVLDVAELARLALGDESVLRLAALGRVEEAAAGAAVRADLLLRAARRAWTMDIF